MPIPVDFYCLYVDLLKGCVNTHKKKLREELFKTYLLPFHQKQIFSNLEIQFFN